MIEDFTLNSNERTGHHDKFHYWHFNKKSFDLNKTLNTIKYLFLVGANATSATEVLHE